MYSENTYIKDTNGADIVLKTNEFKTNRYTQLYPLRFYCDQ